MMGMAPAGSRVVRLSGPQAIGAGLQRLNVSNDLIGSEVAVRAISQTRESLPQSLQYTARHLRPFSPVHGKYDASTHLLSWIRRTRVDGDNWTGLDVPLGEAEELYEVNVFADDSLIDTIIVQTPEYEMPVSLAAQASHVIVAQGSNLYGFGPSLTIPITL